MNYTRAYFQTKHVNCNCIHITLIILCTELTFLIRLHNCEDLLTHCRCFLLSRFELFAQRRYVELSISARGITCLDEIAHAIIPYRAQSSLHKASNVHPKIVTLPVMYRCMFIGVTVYVCSHLPYVPLLSHRNYQLPANYTSTSPP